MLKQDRQMTDIKIHVSQSQTILRSDILYVCCDSHLMDMATLGADEGHGVPLCGSDDQRRRCVLQGHGHLGLYRVRAVDRSVDFVRATVCVGYLVSQFLKLIQIGLLYRYSYR